MEWRAWITVSAVVFMIGLLSIARVGADLVTMCVLTLLLTIGVLTPEQALAGFSNEGMITVVILSVVATGLRETGAMGLVAHRVLGRPQTVSRCQARLMLPTALMSAFIYDAPLVAILLPVVADWAKRIRVSASQVMIPLSYAALLGGTCTLIGTSTNLIVNGLLVSQAGRPALHFFDVTWVGLPCALVGLAYLLITCRWLLPDRRPAFSDQDDPREYTVEMLVEPASPLVGRTIEEAGLRHLPGLYLVEIDRDEGVLPAVSPRERLRGNDRLVFAGIVESVVDLQKMRNLKPATHHDFKLDGPRTHRCLIEAVVSSSCPLVGQTIRDGKFRTVYQAAIIALARNGERVRRKIGDILLQAGDTLLLEAHPWFVERHRNSRDFLLISRVENSAPARHDRAWIALVILLGMVGLVTTRGLSMLNAALLAAALMVLTRCCSGPDARRSIDLRMVVVIAALLGIGRAMEVSGAAHFIVAALIRLAGSNPWIALAVVYGLTMVFTELMTHHAAVVLVFPIALATSQTLKVDLMPFAMAIMMAASFAFATPIGAQPNLMVYGPGGYHFTDYLRIGGPLNLLTWAVTVVIAPLAWPFWPEGA
jgi:di/tricarboxylate transporter